MALIECYGCKKKISDSAENCPHCRFFKPIGDSIATCAECHKEIHSDSEECYNCGSNDPFGEKAKNPVLYRFRDLIIFGPGIALSFYFAFKGEKWSGNSGLYLGTVVGLFIGSALGGLIFNLLKDGRSK